jgi:hypothetical protein
MIKSLLNFIRTLFTKNTPVAPTVVVVEDNKRVTLPTDGTLCFENTDILLMQLRELYKLYPAKPGDKMEEIMFRSGQAEVVLFLRAKYLEQKGKKDTIQNIHTDLRKVSDIKDTRRRA